MTTYVDDMYKSPMGKFGRMKMSHMIADTEAELHEMAQKVGVARRHYQGNHYDVCFKMRQMAVALGAQEVTMRALVFKLKTARGATFSISDSQVRETPQNAPDPGF